VVSEKRPASPQRAEHLIGADVVEAEALLALAGELLPVGPHRRRGGLGVGEVAGVAALVEVEHQSVALLQQVAPPVTRMRRRPASRAGMSGGVAGGTEGVVKA
jgi:hypothetical protein